MRAVHISVGIPAIAAGSVAILMAPTSAQAHEVDSSPATHTVVGGDSVSAIADRVGVSTTELLSANGLHESSTIFPGQTLRVPHSSQSAGTGTAPPQSNTYTVSEGDTVSGIASAHGTNVQSILTANALELGSIIYPGETLTIPRSTTAGRSTPAPRSVAAQTPAFASLTSGEFLVSLDTEQITNVQLIVRLGRELGVPERGIAIALGTAMQESSLRNLTWGDRDSLGLFQQRPSTGWGTSAQVSDKEWSTRAFYGGRTNPNRGMTAGLLDIPGWQEMSFADAAQAVQISAYPDRYARWETQAFSWLATWG